MEHLGRMLVVFAIMAAIGQAAAQPSTTATVRRHRGAILIDEGAPTSSIERARATKKTDLEKHEEKKRQLLIDPGPVYNPNPNPPPPQLKRSQKENRTTSTDASPTIDPDSKEAMGVGDAAIRSTIGTTVDPHGPVTLINGQSESAIPQNRVIGAANALACHPTDNNILYAGFTNGGIWKTSNATNSSPAWLPQTDEMNSLSIGAIEFDTTDPSGSSLIAGIGRFSSLARVGGRRIGALKTTDGGETWNLINGGGSLNGKNICGVAMRGAVVMTAVNVADPYTYVNVGILRSVDSGANFLNVAFLNVGLPQGRAYDLQADPVNPNIFYTVIDDAGTSSGVYKSIDTGATWRHMGSSDMGAHFSNFANAHLAAGRSGSVFVSVVGSSRLSAVYGSLNGGGTWINMDVPTTTESNGVIIGAHPGGQAGIHLSIAADPVNPNLVYIGGDRQPGPPEYSPGSWPNAIGAYNYSGRLFRGNLIASPTTRWQHLTHSSSRGVVGGGTAGNSAPHADSRDMDFDAAGRLIEGDDGGVYCRTSPNLNTGDWYSLQGSLQVTEIHDIAYDSVSNKIIAGTQDNGVPAQRPDNTWAVITQGDGGDVAIDDKTNSGAGVSIRYTSYQNLGGLTKRQYNSVGTQTASASCPLTPIGSDPQISPQFYTPLELNRILPSRFLIGANNGVYESLDQGQTVQRVGSAIVVGDGLSGVGLVYGGRQNSQNYPDVAYAVDGSRVFARKVAGPFPAGVTLATGGGALLDVTMDTEDHAKAFCNDTNQVFRTIDGGATWSDITGDLVYGEDAGEFRSVEFLPNSNGGAICLGTQTGVYIADINSPLSWRRFGTNLPRSAYVYDIEYDSVDDVLVIGTLGRGAWMMQNASGASTGSSVGEWIAY